MMKNCKILLGLFVICFVVIASCSLQPLDNYKSRESEPKETIDSDLIIVGFSQLGSESDWRTANTKSIQNALVKKNGFSLIFSNGRQSQSNQIKAVRSFIFQEVDYIVIAPVTESGWETVLEEAKEANIPVIIVDRMIDTVDDSLYVACVGTDKYAEGQKAGLWLENTLEQEKLVLKENIEASNQALSDENEQSSKSGSNNNNNESNRNDEKIKDSKTKDDKTEVSMNNEESSIDDDVVNIVILEGTPESTAQIGRSKGFEDVAKKHENWHILASENADFTKAKGKEVMAKFLSEYDDIDVLVSQNDDMTFGAIEAIKEAGLTCGVNGQIKIISFDAVAEAFDRMEEGLINVDIECNPLQGEMIADIIMRLEHGLPVDKISYVDGKVFEAKNAKRERTGRTY